MVILFLIEQNQCICHRLKNEEKYISEKINERLEARKKGDFKLADKIREEIDALGYVVEDTDQGPIIKRK